MRNHVIDAIATMAKIDESIVFVNADLGYSVVEKIKDEFPNRYLNVGIAEQNMTSVAAGIALEGNMVFTYSIGNFPTLRCVEQIRNDVCYHNANVKILAVGGGFPYGSLGMTHHATEDIAVMRSLPNMRVYVPADAIEAVACLNEMVSYEGPAYLRMAKGRENDLHTCIPDITKLIPMNAVHGKVAILAAGTILSEAIKCSELLAEKGIVASVYSSPSVKPIDVAGIEKLASECRLVVTMEDHNVVGGFGGAVAEVIANMNGTRAKLVKLGLQDTYTSAIGTQDYIRDYYGISAGKAASKILEIMGEYD